MDLVRDGLNSVGDVHGTNFKMKTGFTPDKANDAQDKTFFNLNNPTEQDRFHWNYTYEANSTQNPQYKYTFPGGTAWLRLFKPKVHAWLGFTMNLSSHMPDITQALALTRGSRASGFADLDLDIGTAADFDEDRSGSASRTVCSTAPEQVFIRASQHARRLSYSDPQQAEVSTPAISHDDAEVESEFPRGQIRRSLCAPSPFT
ncbi:unnamed protein product [Symbiodinium sp. CCMP2592]|nr:unnamed protein product [Symbiodinium sp. CCMP2592]